VPQPLLDAAHAPAVRAPQGPAGSSGSGRSGHGRCVDLERREWSRKPYDETFLDAAPQTQERLTTWVIRRSNRCKQLGQAGSGFRIQMEAKVALRTTGDT